MLKILIGKHPQSSIIFCLGAFATLARHLLENIAIPAHHFKMEWFDIPDNSCL